jgi:hypothetical protein
MNRIKKIIITDLCPEKYIFLSLYIIIYWVSLWLSINTLTSEINYFGQSIIKTVNSLRIIVPLILSFLLFIYLIIYQLKKVVVRKIYNNFFFLFLSFFIFQILGELDNFSFQSIHDNFHLIVFGIGTVSIFSLIDFYKIKEILKYLMLISILIIFLILVITSTQILMQKNLYNFNYFYSLIDANSRNFMEQDFPRITGLSRSFALFNLFNIILFYLIDKKNKFIKYILFILIPFLSLLIWAMQSRGTLICFLITSFLIIVAQKKNLIKDKIFFAFYFILLPIIIFQFYIYIEQAKLLRSGISFNLNNNISEKLRTDKNFRINFFESFQTTRISMSDKSGSGRIEIWNDLISRYDKKKLFGYGPQADRKLISADIIKNYSNNSSSAFFYSFICGGYFGLFIFFLLNIKILSHLYISFFSKKIFSNSVPLITQIAFIYLLFFLIRQFIENSFSMFSIDFLITILSFAIIDSFIKNKKLNYLKFN